MHVKTRESVREQNAQCKCFSSHVTIEHVLLLIPVPIIHMTEVSFQHFFCNFIFHNQAHTLDLFLFISFFFGQFYFFNLIFLICFFFQYIFNTFFFCFSNTLESTLNKTSWFSVFWEYSLESFLLISFSKIVRAITLNHNVLQCFLLFLNVAMNINQN